MPDIVSVIGQRWKLMVLLTLAATLIAFLASLLSAKEYLGVVTALPANPVLNDKARIFNQNIEALYSELGSADELDKIEGTAKLDTLFLSVANDFHLAAHYNIDTTTAHALDKAALQLKRKTNISRSGYGELKIKVWDKDNQTAAALANALLQKINAIHQRLQTENNQTILQRLQEEYATKLQAFHHATGNKNTASTDSLSNASTDLFQQTTLKEELLQYNQLINQYQMALKTTPQVLLVVEHARPSPWPDKPNVGLTVALAFLSSLLFSFLLALFVESRHKKYVSDQQ